MNAVLLQLEQILTNGATNISTFVLNFLAFLILTIVLFLFGFRKGRGSLIAFLISLYIGFALYSVFPFASYVITAANKSKVMLFALKIILYGALSLFNYPILKRLMGRDFFGQSRLGTLLIAFLGSGFIIALLYHTLSAKGVYAFTPSIDQLFEPSQYFFWWFIAPLVGIYFFSH